LQRAQPPKPASTMTATSGGRMGASYAAILRR
jgi:hypothetical protein